MKHGADVNTLDRHGHTPLHCAARKAGRQGAAEVVRSLLRSGADETIVNNVAGTSAADDVGVDVEDEHILAEDVERVRELLANAPADRAWRRRGHLVLCRAYSGRVQLIRENTSALADGARKSPSSSKLPRTEASGYPGVAGGRTTNEKATHDWVDLVAMVLGVQEEGVFRTIVGFL